MTPPSFYRGLTLALVTLLVSLTALFAGTSPAVADDANPGAATSSEAATTGECYSIPGVGTGRCGLPPSEAYRTGLPESENEYLPMKRWIADLGLVTDLSREGFIDRVTNADSAVADSVRTLPLLLSSMGFSLAQIGWQLITVLMDLALTMDILNAFGEQANAIFASLGQSVLSSGIVVLVAIFVVFLAAKAFFSGRLGRVLTGVIVFLVPVAGLQVLVTAASGAEEGEGPPKWSPVWIAAQGTAVVNDIGAGVLVTLTDAGGITNGGESNDFNLTNGKAAEHVDCEDYVNYLKYGYKERSIANTPKNVQGIGFGDINASVSTMLILDEMWRQTYLRSFVTAQYGDAEMGMSMVCKQAEMQRGTTNAEFYAMINPDRNGDSPFAGWGERPFTTFYDSVTGKGAAQVFAWNACRDRGSNGEQVLSGGWALLDPKSPEYPGEVCGTWSTMAPDPDPNITDDGSGTTRALFGGGPDNSKVDDKNLYPPRSAITELTNAKASSSGSADPAVKELVAVGDMLKAYRGENAPQRFTQGALAAITAGMYLWSLGGLSLGVIIAQVGLVLLLMLLPVSLVLAALPSENRKANPGMRMLKLTGGFLITKFVLIATLALMLVMVNVFSQILGSIPGDAGIFLTALAPVAALFLLRYLLKKMGMGDITSPVGAAALTSGAASKAAGGEGTVGKGGAIGKAESALSIGGMASRRYESARKRLQEGKRDKRRAKKMADAINPEGSSSSLVKTQNQKDEKMLAVKTTGGKIKTALKGKKGAAAVVDSEEATKKVFGKDKAGTPQAVAAATERTKGRVQNPEYVEEATERFRQNSAVTQETARKGVTERAKALGVLESSFVASSMSEPAIFLGESNGQSLSADNAAELVETDKRGNIDYERTRELTSATALMPAAVKQHANELITNFVQQGYSREQATHTAYRVVMEDMGLIGSNGETVDAFAAVGIDEDGIKGAIDQLHRGVIPAQMAEFMAAYEEKYRSAQESYEAKWRDVISTQLEMAAKAHTAQLPKMQESFAAIRNNLSVSAGELNPEMFDSIATQYNSLIESALESAVRQSEGTGEREALTAVENLYEQFTKQEGEISTLLAQVAQARNAGYEKEAEKLLTKVDTLKGRMSDSLDTNFQKVYRELDKGESRRSEGPPTGSYMP